MKKKAKYSEEQKQFFKKEALRMLKEGIGQNEGARRLGISNEYMASIKKKLVNENFITQEEIDLKKQEQIEKRLKERKEKSKIKSKEDIAKEIDNKRKTVLELLKQKKTRGEIATILNISKSTVGRYEKYLIGEGLITEDEIMKYQDKTSTEMDKKIARIKELLGEGLTYKEIAKEVNISSKMVYLVNNNKYEEKKLKDRERLRKKKKEVYTNSEVAKKLSGLELDIYNGLLNGYQYSYIEKKLGITHTKCMKIVESLDKQGVLARKKIREAQEMRRNLNKAEVLRLLKAGYTQAEIVRQKENLDRDTVYRIVCNLKKEGKISQEEIDEAKKQGNEEYIDFVLSGLNKGLTIKEIIDLDTTGYLNKSIVLRFKKILIERGKINEKNIKIKSDRKRKIQRKKRIKEIDKEYIELMKKGLTFEEIARLKGFKVSSIKTRWYKLRDEYNISKEKLEKWKKRRRERYEIGQKALNSYIKKGLLKKRTQKFFDFCIQEKELGRNFSRKEIEDFGRVILMDEIFLNTKNLRFVIIEYIRKFNYYESKLYLSKLLRFLDNTIYADSIKQFIAKLDETMEKKIDEADESGTGMTKREKKDYMLH